MKFNDILIWCWVWSTVQHIKISWDFIRWLDYYHWSKILGWNLWVWSYPSLKIYSQNIQANHLNDFGSNNIQNSFLCCSWKTIPKKSPNILNWILKLDPVNTLDISTTLSWYVLIDVEQSKISTIQRHSILSYLIFKSFVFVYQM